MLDIITLLPDHVANQIAAGEVIQRPASVVKELLENAIDADAKSIQLFIKDAGKTLIQVVDDGKGMSPNDLRLAFERHATSKIKIAEDLFALKTMGFRGEALASIAAIAHVETHSRLAEDEVASCLKIEGSKVVLQEPSTQLVGTSIAVKNLFYNIPARRNFLKSNTVELRHLIDEFQRVALAHPEVKFSFFHNTAELFDLPATNLRKRIVGILGSKIDSHLVPVDENTSVAQIKGFVLKPTQAKKTRGQQFLFVNQRFIKSAFLHHAIQAAFEGLLPPGFHPGYVLYMELDPKTIDINIHPTKTEIKFEDEQSLYAILRSAIKHSLGIFQVVPTLDFERNPDMDVPYSFRNKTPSSPPIEVDSNFNPFKEHSQRKPQKDPQWESLYAGLKTDDLASDHKNETEGLLMAVQPASRVFQLYSKYIVCPLQTSMLIIDQNRAHQRVLYERFLSAITTTKATSQQLLFPQTIQLSPLQLEVYKTAADILESLGFHLNLEKKNQLSILGVPEFCPQKDITEVILDALEKEEENGGAESFSQADLMAKKMAKKLAIKTGTVLDIQEQQHLLDDLFGCKETTVSPFNRKIFLTLEKEEIEQKMM